jgi:hypothetical protein
VTAQPRQLTAAEVRLVEQYVSVLDYVSRCAQAIDGDDWYYLADKAGSLAFQAERLARITGELELEQLVRQDRRRPRGKAVRAAVADHGRHCRAARLLHPDQPKGRP